MTRVRPAHDRLTMLAAVLSLLGAHWAFAAADPRIDPFFCDGGTSTIYRYDRKFTGTCPRYSAHRQPAPPVVIAIDDIRLSRPLIDFSVFFKHSPVLFR